MQLGIWILAAGLVVAGGGAAGQSALSDSQVRERIIAESVATYPGRCPCPWNRASNGSKCGGRSAWSKPGGRNPICYPEEVTPDMIAEWRASLGG